MRQMSEDHILFDIPEGEQPIDQEFLEQLGRGVMVCRGPRSGKLCPILVGVGCELAVDHPPVAGDLDGLAAEVKASERLR